MTSDAVIVGARCAGASLAVHLARAGLTVAVLDAAKLPSNQAMSTHLIQPPGMDELDGLGIGARVRARTPGIQAGRFDFDDRTMTLRYGAGRTAHCLRRAELDAMLQAAAVAAGAALQPESRVVGLVRATDGRVTGVDVHRASGRTERLHARLVIGADGRNSTIARLVAAEEYLGYDAPRACYWAYWRRPAGWDAGLLYNGSQRDLSRVLFPTDDDLVLIASSPPVARAHAWRADHRAAYLADLRACAPLAALLGDDEPVGRVLGMVKTRYFFRAAVGPGWALVGDAGHHKEFVTGLGITDALRDARSLARAIVADDATALERHWRQRDVERIETFLWGRQLGRADAVTALERLVAAHVADTPAVADRLGLVVDGHVSPFALFPPARVVPWVAAAALRGNAAPIADLGVVLADAVQARRELGRRKRLLAAVERPRTRRVEATAAARAIRRPALAEPAHFC